MRTWLPHVSKYHMLPAQALVLLRTGTDVTAAFAFSDFF
jgi:hypothetical protein